MKNLRRRVKNIRSNLKKFMMANSPRSGEQRTNFDMFLASNFRERDRVEPSAPPLDLLVADDNHIEAEQSVQERQYFNTDTGFYSAPVNEEVQNPREDTTDTSPDAFSEAAQNDYNSQVERVMQESRQVQADRLLARRLQGQSNRPEPFPVEVDLVGVEASTTLFLLGLVLVFVSRWYAVLYTLVVGFLLYRIRSGAHQEAVERAQRLSHIQLPSLPTPRVFTDMKEAFLLLGHTLAALVFIPMMIVGAISALIWSTRGAGPGTRPRQAQNRLVSPDCKFLLGLMFFPIFIPFWLAKVTPTRTQRPPAVAGRRHGGGAGAGLAAVAALARFLCGRRR